MQDNCIISIIIVNMYLIPLKVDGCCCFHVVDKIWSDRDDFANLDRHSIQGAVDYQKGNNRWCHLIGRYSVSTSYSVIVQVLQSCAIRVGGWLGREAAGNSLGLVMCRLASPNNGKKSEQTAGDSGLKWTGEFTFTLPRSLWQHKSQSSVISICSLLQHRLKFMIMKALGHDFLQ